MVSKRLDPNKCFNIGEWSELYTLIKLLKDGKIYAADEQLARIGSEMYFPIIRIRREEVKNEVYDYFTPDDEQFVRIYHNGEFVKSLPLEQFDEVSLYMYHKLSTAGNGGIKLEQLGNLQALLDELNINKVKAGNDEKADIVMEIIDVHTGYRPLAGFSIKSQLGSPPTLLNASQATNFIYKLYGMSDKLMRDVNDISTEPKIRSRFSLMQEHNVKFEFAGMHSQIFSDNLEMIDSSLPEIVAHVLLYRFIDNINDFKSIVKHIIDDNPLCYHKAKIYEYKLKKLLCSVALGMVPSKDWDGLDEANGGYIVVKEDGDVVAYYIYNRNAFENYLLDNTRLEAGSTTRHKYCTVYKENEEYFINLNLQIRFK